MSNEALCNQEIEDLQKEFHEETIDPITLEYSGGYLVHGFQKKCKEIARKHGFDWCPDFGLVLDNP